MLSLWNMRSDDTLTAEKGSLKANGRLENRGRSSRAMVNTQWRCGHDELKGHGEVVRVRLYMLPQVGQKLE